MKRHSLPLLAAAALGGIATVLFSCRENTAIGAAATAVSADTIFHNGSILTMAGKTPTYVEALAVKDIKVMETFKAGQSIYRAD